MDTPGTTTNLHADDSALGTFYDYTNGYGYNLILTEQSFTGVFTVAAALDMIPYEAITPSEPAELDESGFVFLASNADMNTVTVNGSANSITDVVTVNQLEYWVDNVVIAKTNNNGFISLVPSSKLNRTETSNEAITISALNTFLNDSSNSATTNTFGVMQIATLSEAQLGEDNTKAVTSESFIQILNSSISQSNTTSATETILGNVRLATTAEAIAATNNYDVLTPYTNKVGFDTWIEDWWAINDNTSVITAQINAVDDKINANASDIQDLQDLQSTAKDAGLPIGSIIALGDAEEIPAKWALCDGSNGTPDLRGRFLPAAGSVPSNTDFRRGTKGGSIYAGHSHKLSVGSTTLTWDQIPPHKHNTGWGQLVPGLFGDDIRAGGPPDGDPHDDKGNIGAPGYTSEDVQFLTASHIINPNSTDGNSYRTTAKPHTHNPSVYNNGPYAAPPYYVTKWIKRIY